MAILTVEALRALYDKSHPKPEYLLVPPTEVAKLADWIDRLHKHWEQVYDIAAELRTMDHTGTAVRLQEIAEEAITELEGK